MNYLQQVVAFCEYKSINPLSSGQIALWYALMEINNKCCFAEWFSVSNKVLEFRTGLSKSGVYKARKTLKEKGFIDFRFNGDRATEYHIIPIDLFQNSNRFGSQDRNPLDNQSGNRDCNRGSNTLNKQNKTKEKNIYYNKSAVKKSPLNNYNDENKDDYYKLEEEVLNMMLNED